ncbi:hypothetical protein SDC9_192535 [bioreactor metagenome]|uniref:Uncharacterized protein n=1 Tax=bioreactor metagenome TaxID=1076179 RepID=A0A645I134_9ZZZZ
MSLVKKLAVQVHRPLDVLLLQPDDPERIRQRRPDEFMYMA